MKPTEKYIITDKNEIKIGGENYHFELAEDCKGKVISAGFCRLENGKYIVFGGSTHFGIQSKPEDANILNKCL